MISALIDLMAVYFQAGDLPHVELIARSLLSSIPEDLVALQFLGLALYQMGQTEEAQRVFAKVPASFDRLETWDGSGACQPAGMETFRAATRVHPGLAEGWNHIALLLSKLGYHKQADRAFEAASAAHGQRRRSSIERRRLNTAQ